VSGEVLLVVDTQRGAFEGEWAMPQGDALVAACQRAIAWARRRGTRVVWVQHHEVGGPMSGAGFEIDPRLAPRPDEPRILKTEPNALSNTALAPLLQGAARVWVVGLQSDCCVQATALAAHQAGWPVTVVADAHHTWPNAGRSAETVRDAVNADLAAAGVPLTTLAELDPA
jgi:nicotinamidase-related amidase